MAQRDPGRAAAIEARACEALRRFGGDFRGDPATGRLPDDERRQDLFFARHAALPCPALDPAAGRCDLYSRRPVSCRTFGPPVTIGGRKLPPCVLCFQGASPAEIERCRVERDPAGMEDGALTRLEESGGGEGETTVAHALARDTD